MGPFSDTILVKTPRGRAEVAGRQHDLCRLERLLLILADGRRTVDAIAAELAMSPEDLPFRQALERLEQGRYVDRLEELESVA